MHRYYDSSVCRVPMPPWKRLALLASSYHDSSSAKSPMFDFRLQLVGSHNFLEEQKMIFSATYNKDDRDHLILWETNNYFGSPLA